MWKLFGLTVMMFVGAAATGSFTARGAMAALTARLGFVCYAVYERAWANIARGRSTPITTSRGH